MGRQLVAGLLLALATSGGLAQDARFCFTREQAIEIVRTKERLDSTLRREALYERALAQQDTAIAAIRESHDAQRRKTRRNWLVFSAVAFVVGVVFGATL